MYFFGFLKFENYLSVKNIVTFSAKTHYQKINLSVINIVQPQPFQSLDYFMRV